MLRKTDSGPYGLLPVGLLWLLLGCSATSPEGPAPPADAPPEDLPWYRQCLVGMEVGPTGAQFGSDPSDTGYARRFNGREIVRECVEAGSEYVIIWARDGEYAYYDSEVQMKCPGLGERDPLQEAVEEGRRQGVPVIAYCVVQYGSRAMKENPHFEMRGPDGKPLGRICFNSGYLEYMKKLTSEMLSYGIDGFHLDMMDQGFGPPYGCWCDACTKLFEKEYGHPMPEGVTWDESWDHMLEFRYATSARFEKALREHIRSVAPQATADYNYHGYPPFSWEVGQRPVQHAHVGDFVTAETGIWGFSALGVSLTAEFIAATKPGAIYQVAMQRGVRMYHDQTTRPLNDIRWELLTLLAHGTRVTMVDKTAYDGWLDPVAYERIGAAFREARAKRAHFGQEPVREVGLYYSSRSRDWYGREEPWRYQQSVHGAHRACVYEHLQAGFLLDENLTLEALRRFPVVCLPNATILSAREVDLLRHYVEGGGNLLVTGQSGLYGWRGEPQEESALSGLLGAKLVELLETVDNHVRLSGRDAMADRLADGIRRDWPFLVKGPATVYEPAGATPIGALLKPHRTVRQTRGDEPTEWPMSAGEVAGPAALLHAVGKGRVLTLACSPDFATASEHPVVEARLLLRNAVRLLHPERRLAVDAPAHVEAFITDDPAARTLRVHLLGYLSPPAATPKKGRPFVLPSLIEDAPLYRATITVNGPFREATALEETTELQRDGNHIRLVVNEIHDVVLVRY